MGISSRLSFAVFHVLRTEVETVGVTEIGPDVPGAEVLVIGEGPHLPPETGVEVAVEVLIVICLETPIIMARGVGIMTRMALHRCQSLSLPTVWAGLVPPGGIPEILLCDHLQVPQEHAPGDC